MSFGINKGVEDTKATRLLIIEKANLMLNSLLASVGSVYVRSNSFPLFATQLKAIAFEAARVIVTAENIYNDLIFKNTRPEFIFQNIQSFLFLNSNYTHSEEDDVALRSFLLALIQSYFQGATKLSIQNALQLAIENKASVELEEIYLQGRGNTLIDSVPLMHRFLVSIFVASNTIDVVKLQNSITFLASLIKPAHTAITTRFVYIDPIDELGFSNACVLVVDPLTGKTVVGPDGFELTQKLRPNAICDVFNMAIFDYGYGDIRKNCLATKELEVSQEAILVVTPTKLKTRYGPLSNGANGILSDVSQVKVYVDGDEVEVESVDALKGIINLVDPIPYGSVVRADYTFLRRHFEYFTINNTDTVLNQFDPYTETIHTFRYSSVLWAPEFDIPNREAKTCDYKYSGFDALNSSLLNDPNTLVFNKSSVRDKLNDYNIFKSYGYDDGEHIVSLNYGEYLFPTRMEKTLIPQDDTVALFKLNDPLSLMNTLTHNLLGGRTSHQAFGDTAKKVYADFTIESTCTNGVEDNLKPICEDGLDLFFDFASSSDTYKGIEKSVDEVLVLNNSGYVLNRFELFFPPELAVNSSFSKIELNQRLSDDYALIDEVISGFHQEVEWFELDYKNKDLNQMVTNSVDHGIGTTGTLLPPNPSFPFEDLLIWNVGMYGEENFLLPKFVLNDFRSHLNDVGSLYSYIRRKPGNNDQYISDFLREFRTTQTFETYYNEEFDITGGGATEQEFIQINDFISEFPITGYDQILEFNMAMYQNELIPQVTEDNPSGFSFRFQDGFPRGHVVLFPYFMANFAPIFDILQSQQITLSGGAFEEAFAPIEDLYMNCFHPSYSEQMPRMLEELTSLNMEDGAFMVKAPVANIIPSEEMLSKFDGSNKSDWGISGGV
jgi:hypothetical protein